MTMGGNILGLPMRSMPGWRAGLWMSFYIYTFSIKVSISS
jgi:hypothetical protein